MKKRILAFALCILVCMSTISLVSCSVNTEDELQKLVYGDEVTTSDNELMEITIYGITDASTTDAAISEVQNALNQISVRKYNTKVKLFLFPEETYASIVFNKLQSSVNAYNTVLLEKYEKEGNKEEKALIKSIDFGSNEKVNVSSSIPSEVSTATIDIFLAYNPAAGSETLNPESEYYNQILANNGMFGLLYESMALVPLKSKISSGTYSALKSNSYPEAIQFVTRANYKTKGTDKVVDDIYAIPNNYVYGGYKYVILNKDVVNEFYSAENKDPSFTNDISAQSVTNENVIKALRAELNTIGAETLGVTQVERTEPFKSYEEFVESSKTESYAIAYAEGDLGLQELIEKSGKYGVYKTEVTKVTQSQLCESMFCISKSASDYVERCLDILLLLNTDSTFRNIFQYGLKDTHYNEGRDGTIYVTGTTANRYIMDPKYTGNMFILTPSDNMSESMKLLASNKWKLGKVQISEVLEKYKSAE